MVAAIFVLPVAGAVIGYEAFAPRRRERETAQFGLMPIVSVETTGVAAFGIF